MPPILVTKENELQLHIRVQKACAFRELFHFSVLDTTNSASTADSVISTPFVSLALLPGLTRFFVLFSYGVAKPETMTDSPISKVEPTHGPIHGSLSV